jgi:hypothetical protein
LSAGVIPRVWSTRADPPSLSDHREAYAEMENLEGDYNASAEDGEGGPIEKRMHEACDRERAAFDIMVSTEPRTHNERLALIAYVDEVGRRQEEKGHWDGGREILAANLREFAMRDMAVPVGADRP